MRQFWASLRAAKVSARQSAQESAKQFAMQFAKQSARQAGMLALTVLVSLPASAQDAGFVDSSQPSSPLGSYRIQRNTTGRQPDTVGRKPYTLGARKTHIITEQEQSLEPPAAGLPLTRQIPRADNSLNAAASADNSLNANVSANSALNANISANAIPLNAGKAALGAFQQPAEFLRGKTKTNVHLLSEYDVELIVDSSQSMRKLDCPGGLSRWNWCGIQANDLGRQLVPYVPRGLTITAFARDYNVYHNATPGNIAELFDNPNFRGGTRLSKPLYDRLNEFFVRRQPGSKPLLIAVITDGVPRPFEEPALVAKTLVNATMRMRDPREVTVVFFQIGSRDRFGRAFLNYLDNGLVENGARYDFVKAVPFEHLVQVGLPQALVESIQQFAASSAKTPMR